MNGYRMVVSIAGTLGAIILATILGWTVADRRLLFAGLGVAIGLVSIAPPWIVFRLTRDLALTAPQEPLAALKALRATLLNTPFRMVMGLYLLSWTTASILSAVLIYFASYHMRIPDQANYFVLTAQGSAIMFIPVSVWLSRRLDKRRAFVVGTATWIGVLLGISALESTQIGLAYLLAALSGFGIATAYVVPWSMLPDVIEHDQAATGQRREGSFYALASFFQKLGTGAALWGMGQALALSGYVTPSAAAALPVQPTSTVTTIRLFTGPVPAVLLAGAIFFAMRYPITREAHRVRVAELAGRDA